MAYCSCLFSFAYFLFILATADDKEGGTDIPVSEVMAEQICSIGFPDYADSVYCSWWTGGTKSGSTKSGLISLGIKKKITSIRFFYTK